MKRVNFLSKTSSQSYGHSMMTSGMTVGSPSLHRRYWMLRLMSVLVLVLTFGVGQIWGQGTESFENLSSATSYDSRSWTGTNGQTGWAATNARTDQKTAGSRGLTFKASTASTITMKLTSAQQGAGLGVLTFKYYYPFSDSGTSRQLSITIGSNTYSSGTLSYTSSATTGSITVNQSLASATVTINVNNGGGRICVDEFSWTAAASCGADPTVGVPTLTSIASNSITVSCPSISAGTNCSIDDYGFVWRSGGSDPTISNNKSQVGTNNQSTSYSKALSITVSTGTTYKIKAYAHNGHGNGLSASSLTVIPQTISFNGNTSTSGSMSTQYVNRNTSTAITSNAFSKTGYNFAGWATSANGNVVYTNGQSVTISSNQNLSLFAKWTAKTTTVSFNQNSGTGGQTSSVTATYDADMPTPITVPTRDHYDFGGYYDGAGGTGTQYYTSTGTSARTWNKEASTATLYAKWTPKSYTVNWVVAGSTISTVQVTYNTTAALPTAPNPGEHCGHKFMGWTTVKDHDAATAPSPLITSAPTVTGDVTYNAVFGYYEE